jgi:hypothetical protein
MVNRVQFMIRTITRGCIDNAIGHPVLSQCPSAIPTVGNTLPTAARRMNRPSSSCVSAPVTPSCARRAAIVSECGKQRNCGSQVNFRLYREAQFFRRTFGDDMTAILNVPIIRLMSAREMCLDFSS